MLRRFELIKGFGIFDDFRWNIACPDFERINLIYGANGSGKTSLARALDGLKSASEGFKTVSIRMSDVDKANERQSRQANDAEFERVFVFSDGYVSRSHNFDGDTEIDAVLTLGERSIEDEKRIAELKGLIETAEGNLRKTSKDASDADKTLDYEYTTIARGIVTSLSRAGGEYRSNGSFSKGTVKTRFAGSHSTWVLLSEKEKKAALATVNSDERELVPNRSYSLSVRAGLIEEAATALASSPVSVILDTLADHEDASSWVESGRHLHEGLNKCIFCGGDLTEDRKKQIERHFSDEVEQAQRSTDGLIREIKGLQAASQTLLGDGAISGSLFEDLRGDFKKAHAAAKVQVNVLGTWLKGLLEALDKKRANVVARVEYEIANAPVVNGADIEKALKDHNVRVAQHATLANAAAKRVELHLLKEAEGKVAELDSAAKEAVKAKSDLIESLRKYREDVAALENVEGDPLPSAEVMARELTRILGRSELSFELLPDGKHYRVIRNGKAARDLSTGERTAITLIHFLENVKASVARSGKAMVVIDDPVSSLDSGAAMGISTYIWSEVVSKGHIEQVFLLTHNFELFRQWDIQIDGLPGTRGPTNNKGFPSRCYELIAPHQNVDGDLKRVPEFVVWPPNGVARVKVRSAYHHAFITAASAHASLAGHPSMEQKLDALLLYPNVLRRMLETFLAFKNPASVGKFTNSMRDIGASLEALDYAGDADALRLQLTRFTHANSHAESPETDAAVNPEEIGAVIAAVFTFMNAVDQKHFEGLCEVIGVDPSDLLLQTQPVVDLMEVIEGV